MGIQSSSKLFVKGLSISPPLNLGGGTSLHWKATGVSLSPLENLTNSWAPLAACLITNGCQRPRVLWDFGT